MAETVKLKLEEYQLLREVNPMLMSYNVEFAEVTGATFWKAYTAAQVAGLELFAVGEGTAFQNLLSNLMQIFPPIDLYNPRLRKLAKAFGPVWVRVSGGWATRTYYDFDGSTGGKSPEGYQNVLTKEMWLGVLDFLHMLYPVNRPYAQKLPSERTAAFGAYRCSLHTKEGET